MLCAIFFLLCFAISLSLCVLIDCLAFSFFFFLSFIGYLSQRSNWRRLGYGGLALSGQRGVKKMGQMRCCGVLFFSVYARFGEGSLGDCDLGMALYFACYLFGLFFFKGTIVIDLIQKRCWGQEQRGRKRERNIRIGIGVGVGVGSIRGGQS